MSITDYLDSTHPNIKNHVEIKLPDTHQPYALHISKDKYLKEMIPQIGTRQSKHEDRTMPRICVCDSLIDCINGYQALIDDYIRYHPLKTINDENTSVNEFHGGWYIYAIPYDYGLIPDNTLVYDQSITNEYWLIHYDDNTTTYTPSKIGKFFMRDYTRKYCDALGIRHRLEMYLEIDSPIYIFKDNLLRPGYYHLYYTYYNKENLPSNLSDITVSYKEITPENYLEIKKNTVSLLSHHDRPFIHW